MSVRALTWSFALQLQDMAAKAVLHALADHANETGRCWPSVKRIAQWAGCNEKTARKALQRVVEMGAVVREERPGKSDTFVLQFDWTPPNLGTTKNDPSLNREVPKTTLTPPKNDPDPSLNRESNRKEPSNNHQTADAAVSVFVDAAIRRKWPHPRTLGPDRQKKLNARLAEHGLDGWKAAISRAESSAFINSGDARWWSFDWLLKPANFTKLIEGNYDNRHADPPRQAAGWN